MLTDDLLARLEQLNRQRLPPVVSDRKQPVELPASVALADLLPGEEIESEAGPHYRVRRALSEYWPQAVNFVESQRARGVPDGVTVNGLAELSALAAALPSGTIFLDLETCGFAGSPLFLIGLIHVDDDRLVVDQLLARDYTEERAVLATLWRLLTGRDVLVTFNGKSFDWPMVRDRTFFHRLDHRGSDRRRGAEGPPVHCDLLHHARRRWKAQLPDCRLQTLERYICRRMRRGDIPGSRIPHEYHRFVRTGDARQMVSVLHHNALDLVTLFQLSVRVITGQIDPRRGMIAAGDRSRDGR